MAQAIHIWDMVMNYASDWGTGPIAFRLLLSLIVGVVVGIDRGLKRRGAGVKTHALVCMGSALVMLTSEYMALNFEVKADMARMGAQVISGIGFLGVGTILVTGKNQIRGLTTAAGLWTCACIGLAVGIGFVEGAILALLFVMITLRLLTKLDAILHRYARVFDIYLEFDNNKNITLFLQEMRARGIKVSPIEIAKSKVQGKLTSAIVSIEIQKKGKRPYLLDEIRALDFVRYVEEL